MSRYVASLARRCFIATCESSVPSCSPSCALVETVRSFSTLRIASQGCGKATDELRGTVLPPVAREIVSQQQQARQFSSTGSPIMLKSPSDAGGPPKPYSSMKRRFKVTGSGAIRCMSPGFVHKRFNKSKKRLNRLSKGILVPPTYEKAMKKLGFVSRRF